MAHIPLPADQPGVIGPLMAYPETEKPLDALTNVLMTGPSSLTRGERELIAAYVSRGNECRFCTTAHAAVAKQLLGDQGRLVDQTLTDVEQAQLDPKLRALLAIAEKVRRDGRL